MTEYLEFPTKQLNDTNLLFNKNKISADIASLSSMSSMSSASSIRSNLKKKNKQRDIGGSNDMPSIQQPKKLINPNITINKRQPSPPQKPSKKYIDDDEFEIRSNKSGRSNKSDDDDDDDDDDDGDDDDGDDADDRDDGDDGEDDDDEGEDEEDGDEVGDEYPTKKTTKMNPYKDELNEKKEILYQLNRLKLKGVTIPHNFTINSNIDEMRQEYNKIIRDRDIDASIRFQRKMLMAFVSGTEYLNSRYDPFMIKLEGWSEQVHENIEDFDDIFEELHVKYKSKGKSMPPELRLFISLSGSAFMFHLTSKMFKESSIPGVEEVLKANPELMKQFQNAAAKQFIYNNIGGSSSKSQQQTQPAIKQNTNSNNNNGSGGGVNSLFGNSSGLFGMVNNLFSGLNSNNNTNNNTNNNNRNERNEMSYNNRPENDINKIINNVHNKISLHPDDDSKIETLSISDEEITSIIEDATDVKILKSSTRGRKSNNNNLNRTLNI
jgi:hypothetical protein